MGFLSRFVLGNSKAGRKEVNNERQMEQTLKRMDQDKAKQQLIKRDQISKPHLQEVPEKLRTLAGNGVTIGVENEPFYRFTSTNKEGAAALQKIFEDAKYNTNPIEESEGNFVLSGKSYPRKVDDKTIKDWIKNICLLGVQNQCEFQEWSIENKA